MTENDPVTKSKDLEAAHELALGLLEELQTAVAAKDIDATLGLFAEDAVVFGSAAENLDRDMFAAYLTRLFEQPGSVRWNWERVLVLDARPGLVTFSGLGTAGFEGGENDHDPIRLTCLAVDEGDRWRLRHFHGSVPQG